MDLPENLYYTTDHLWLKVENNEALVGITHFPASEFGDIFSVDVEIVDGDLLAGEECGIISTDTYEFDILMPVTGKILDRNTKLEDNPEPLNDDPFGSGQWIIKILIDKPGEINSLMTHEQYLDFIK